jgi:hypothetical protein
MKILVPVKRVVDYNVKIRVKPAWFTSSNVMWIVSALVNNDSSWRSLSSNSNLPIAS